MLIFDKTEKGRNEISTRKFHLAPRLRALLVLVDGKQDKEALLKKVAGIGLDENSLQTLIDQGFVSPVDVAIAGSEDISSANEQAWDEDGTATDESVEHSDATQGGPDSSATLPNDREGRFIAIYHFYNETIKSTLGFRGFPLQLKVERASSIEEFDALRQPFLDAVRKVAGQEIAEGLATRLDTLFESISSPEESQT